MSRPVPGSRPPVLAQDTREALDEYRRFRRRVTHAYGSTLEWSKMRALVEDVPSLRARVAKDLATFNAYVEHLIAELERPASDSTRT